LHEAIMLALQQARLFEVVGDARPLVAPQAMRTAAAFMTGLWKKDYRFTLPIFTKA
jgi:hypothetical protein